MSYELLEQKIAMLEKQLADEHEKVQNLEGRLVFEKNKYELQVAELSADLSEKITDTIELELQGMEDITARLDEKNKDRLERFIARIRRKLSDLH